MKIFLADVTLWEREFDGAFELYQQLHRQFPNDLDVTKGYLNAAGKSSKPLNEQEIQTVQRLADSKNPAETGDALLQARLAEV